MRMRINVEEYLTKAAPIGNPGLQSGDTVYLPHREKAWNPLAVLTVAGTILGLTAAVITITHHNH